MISQLKETVNSGIITIKNQLNSIDKPVNWWLQLGSYVLIGFVTGLILKHIGRILLMTLLTTLVVFWALNYFALITVHYEMMAQLVGLGKPLSFNETMLLVISWIRAHVVESLSLLLGFFLAKVWA